MTLHATVTTAIRLRTSFATTVDIHGHTRRAFSSTFSAFISFISSSTLRRGIRIPRTASSFITANRLLVSVLAAPAAYTIKLHGNGHFALLAFATAFQLALPSSSRQSCNLFVGTQKSQIFVVVVESEGVAIFFRPCRGTRAPASDYSRDS